ncbi:MAG: BtpA/SgcQ family protein [bacterium]|nr:BtpA/SgcQ family protein [bacterium]
MEFKKKSVIGMIHVPALPGTPGSRLSISAICSRCRAEAEMYLSCGIDALMIENMHDVPYLKGKVGPEITAAMSVVGHEVKKTTGKVEVGIQILAAANKEAIAAALAGNLDFIRAEGYVFGHVADEGYIDSRAGELLRYRKAIGADCIQVFTDIKKKHSSHNITADIDIVDTAEAAAFFLADALIITGSHTGNEPNINEVKKVKQSTDLPVILGSGITADNISRYLPHADAFIIGSYFKKDGDWRNEPDPVKVKSLMERVK